MDIGCGEGSLLASLCNPALYISESILQPDDLSGEDPESGDDDFPELHIRKLDGLDVSLPDLNYAIKDTKPPDADVSSYGTFPRWEPLIVRIWHGGLEHFNEEFVGAECVVATEV